MPLIFKLCPLALNACQVYTVTWWKRTTCTSIRKGCFNWEKFDGNPFIPSHPIPCLAIFFSAVGSTCTNTPSTGIKTKEKCCVCLNHGGVSINASVKHYRIPSHQAPACSFASIHNHCPPHQMSHSHPLSPTFRMLIQADKSSCTTCPQMYAVAHSLHCSVMGPHA